MARWLNRLLLAMNIVILGGASYFVVTRGLGSAGTGQPWQPVEIVTVVLAVLAALITILGAFIAVIAIWGYTRLSDEARSAAQKAATDHAEKIVGQLAPRLVAEEAERRFGSRGTEYAAAAAEGNGNDDKSR